MDSPVTGREGVSPVSRSTIVVLGHMYLFDKQSGSLVTSSAGIRIRAGGCVGVLVAKTTGEYDKDQKAGGEPGRMVFHFEFLRVVRIEDRKQITPLPRAWQQANERYLVHH